MGNTIKTSLDATTPSDISNILEERMEVDPTPAQMTEIFINDFTPPPPRGRPGGSGGSGDDGDDDPYASVGLDDVGGLEEQKQYLIQCILNPLKGNSQATQWGISPPKGVLFYGPPGTGKTLLARAFGNELSKQLGQRVTFFHCKGGEFLSKWFGESNTNVRNLFARAKTLKPSIIFLDELDGICPERNNSASSVAYNSIVATLLGEMDNLPVGQVFVFGATNRVETVDSAMRRPGRFDKHLEFFIPDLAARTKIIQINTKKWKSASRPSGNYLEILAQQASGYTGADLEKLCREAFFAAFSRHVPNSNLEISIDNMQVIGQDWESALGKVKPTNSAVYGSTIYAPSLPHQDFEPLLASSRLQIGSLLNQKLGNLSMSDEGLSVSSVFIGHPEPGTKDKSLEKFLIPAILTEKKFDQLAKTPVFQLTKEGILSKGQNEFYQGNYIEETINQAKNPHSSNKRILYVPRIDCIVSSCSAYVVQVLAQNLASLNMHPVLLIATGAENVSKIQDNVIRQLFTNSYQYQNPGVGERKSFLNDLFFKTAIQTVGRSINVTKSMEKHLGELLDSAVKVTEGDSAQELARFHDEIHITCARYFRIPTKENLFSDLQDKIQTYGVSRWW